ncbi:MULTISPECIES: cation-transporting P-type ATPase [Halomonadaceae]|uniref:cation-transporting P-type ATPase n=1 Tax=Halomonadaceae TaxID=28256 RepID=UPI001581F062|nr:MULTISPECIES: cation-transporting P-type ATPase [Halomonas]MDI4639277.1 cation-transporting P-type ATPase [Halomonas sp. BMC7]NUJ60268.1 cation-transporting P-type ATPase [Halomonas taeanensis]
MNKGDTDIKPALDDKSARDRAGSALLDWHTRPADAVAQHWEVAPGSGLDEAEVTRRRERFGLNRLPEAQPHSSLMRFLAQFRNLLIYVLIGAALITALLGHWVDMAVILGVVLLNAVIGFVQEGKAEDALRAIRDMLSVRAMVIRGGRQYTLPAEELVPGDVVLMQAGDRVPADLRLWRARGLQIEEAALTGESVAQEKSIDPVPVTAVLGDRIGMAYSGTLVTHGQGAGIVVGTGADTEIGRISHLVSQVETLTTPLLRQMATFSRWLTGAVLAVALLIFLFGILWRGMAPAEMFMTVVGLAVAAIPEGLPAILTVTLAIGVQRLAGRHAIIRRLPVVETLGSVSVICSDKTGTLTRNEMMVRSLVSAAGRCRVEGDGYLPRGDFLCDEATLDPARHPWLQRILRAGLLCNDTTLEQVEDGWQVHGDPMEGALIAAALKGGLDADDERAGNPRIDLIPFDAQHKFMATLHQGHEGEACVFVKGAPEQVLRACHAVWDEQGEQPLDLEAWEQDIEALAAQGQRVLAVACKAMPSHAQEVDFPDVASGLVLLGLLGLIDPPREEAIRAVADCREAGIRVKMITGDHAGTARAISAQLDLSNSDEVITGQQLESMDDEELARRIGGVDVYARVSPEHKLRLVTLLQAQQAIVAMTGDGVNDAPALKRADVGIAMGRKGTEAAKEASEMVIADDNFASIVRAVEQGRTVYDNLKKAIVFLLPINGGEAMSILVAVLFGLTLPITPVQILWVNMVSSVALAMALAFEATEPEAMRQPPRAADEAMISGFLLWRIALVALLMAAGVFGIFRLALSEGASLEEARTYAVNTLVLMEIFYLFSVRFLRTPSLTWERMFNSRAAIIAVAVVAVLQLMFTYAPFMERFFDTRPVDFVHGVEILLIGVGLFAVLELEKLGLRRRARRRKRSGVD